MGIANPRPAMRAGEEHRVRTALQLHADLRKQIRESGVPDDIASKIAFDIVSTHIQRRKIWMNKESKTFDTSTVEGLESAERYKRELENKYDKVVVTPVGLDRVRIEGRKS